MLEINVIVICIEAYFLLYNFKGANFKKAFCIFACIQAIILSGLRHVDVGPDTFNYVNMFERVKTYSWDYLWDHLIHMFEYEDDVEPGFYMSMKIFQFFSKNPRTYLITYACFVNIPLFVWFYKKSSNLFISTLIYFCLFFAFVSTTGLRQTMVFVILIFIGTELVLQRRLVLYLALTSLCYTFHRSSIAMIPLYFLVNFKFKQIHFVLAFVFFVLLFIFRTQYTQLLAGIGGYDRYANQYEGAGTWTFTFLMLAIITVTALKYRTIYTVDQYANFYINCCITATLLLPITYIDPTTMRVVYYYAIYSMFLVPDIILTFRNKDQRLVHLVIIGLLLLLYLKNANLYAFFWQNGFTRPGPSV